MTETEQLALLVARYRDALIACRKARGQSRVRRIVDAALGRRRGEPIRQPQPQPRPGDPGTWTTREGVTLRIADMDDKHLRNTIAFLERKIDDDNRALLSVYSGPWPQGEEASLDLDNAVDRAEEKLSERRANLDELKAEARKRAEGSKHA